MIISPDNYRKTAVGSKARNLFLLQEAGFPVPPFFCVDETLNEAEVPAYLDANFPDVTSFSVRSCASLEDSAGYSFAGQFRTFLRVPREEVCCRIRDVLSGREHPETISYCQIHNLDPSSLKMYVIIQKMVEADLSGILFTANPQGILNESVIVCGFGSGDQVVEDRTDTTAYYYNLTDKACYYEQTGASPLLSDARVEELILSSQKIKKLFSAKYEQEQRAERGTAQGQKSHQESHIKSHRGAHRKPRGNFPAETDTGFPTEFDMEFAVKGDTLYFLQVRPITAFDREAPLIILDNSNIVESYPGITLPLTQSFIGEAYYQVFRSLLTRLTREPKTVGKIDDTLRHMVDTANGRIYYRISNWYDVLLFLPFHNRLIPIWQEMMGVKNKTVSSGLSGQITDITRFKVACSFFRLLLTCPRQMTKLDAWFREIIERFESLNTETEDNLVLLNHYRGLLNMTVQKWDLTLVNDMYGFLFTGLLKSRLKSRHVPDYELAANKAISGIQKLESMRPIEELQKLAESAEENGLLADLKALDSNEACFKYIRDNDTAFSRSLQAYIREFGDRNLEELKLESKTFRTDPVLLIRCILQYAEAPADSYDENVFQNSASADAAEGKHFSPSADAAKGNHFSLSAGTAEDRHFSASTDSARERHFPACKNMTPDSAPSPPLTGLTAFFAKRAATGIRNREKSRLHRGRLYGMMRSLALQMGKNLCVQRRIDQPEDIFWLYCEEIEAAALNSSMELKAIISDRKKQYEGFAALPSYSRLIFSGKVTDKAPKNSQKIRCEEADGIYTGTPCSAGCAEGEVLVVDHPSPDLETRDKILVTKMTDPGWVFLIARAKAILSEKGSLLSHTAIISRELRKPSVVGVEHITEYLKTGDVVRVDGDSGIVEKIKETGEPT